MTANLDLLDSAMLAEAAYAEFLQPNGQLKPLADIRAALVAKDWSGTQVDAFLANYRVIHQQPNTATGFSATFGRANRFTPRHDQVAIDLDHDGNDVICFVSVGRLLCPLRDLSESAGIDVSAHRFGAALNCRFFRHAA